jgi:hypothetical protein
MSCNEPVHWSSRASWGRSNALFVFDLLLVRLQCRVNAVGVGGSVGGDQDLLLLGLRCAQAPSCRVELRRRLDGKGGGHRRIAAGMVEDKDTLMVQDYTKG